MLDSEKPRGVESCTVMVSGSMWVDDPSACLFCGPCVVVCLIAGKSSLLIVDWVSPKERTTIAVAALAYQTAMLLQALNIHIKKNKTQGRDFGESLRVLVV